MGGRVLFGSNDLVSQIDRCLDDARDFYVLHFKPSTTRIPTSITASLSG